MQGGTRFGQLYYAVADQTKGAKAAVGGTCPPVGAGALLGGGLGFLTRQYGLGCDSFVAARLVDAEGAVLEVDSKQRPDLLAALCGAGAGNYGARAGAAGGAGLHAAQVPSLARLVPSGTPGPAANSLPSFRPSTPKCRHRH